MSFAEIWRPLLAALHSMSPWELAAVLLAIGYLLLAVRENQLCWLFAFVSSAIYTVLFWDVRLLMDSALNVYYVAMAVFGWHQWTRGGGNGDQGARGLEVRSLSGRQNGAAVAAITALTLLSGYLLAGHSTAAWPYVDSFTTWASVVTTYLVARKYLQNWLYWIVIDTVSAALYVERGLHLTALLFVAYTIIAVVGYFRWREQLSEKGRTIAA